MLGSIEEPFRADYSMPHFKNGRYLPKADRTMLFHMSLRRFSESACLSFLKFTFTCLLYGYRIYSE